MMNSARPRCISSARNQLLVFDRRRADDHGAGHAAIDEPPSNRSLRKRRGRNRTSVVIARTGQRTSSRQYSGEVPPLPFSSNQAKEKFSRTSGVEEVHHRGRHHPGRRSQRFGVETKASPWTFTGRALGESLALHVPARTRRLSLVGASPEIHVRARTTKVEIRPSPGRVVAARLPDEMSAWKKNSSPTEGTREHVMLVDLGAQ